MHPATVPKLPQTPLAPTVIESESPGATVRVDVMIPPSPPALTLLTAAPPLPPTAVIVTLVTPAGTESVAETPEA
jgi:hypothetical protein